ncbi:FG-GAP-like repeat-containing protein [Pantanalinema rosaneae CENA516]|uniref:FG-GAP repeat domain-containing protein n=1 Tax=Pantanalinema rosaneae TaxID=1620701 RepID=UPI003D6F4398
MMPVKSPNYVDPLQPCLRSRTIVPPTAGSGLRPTPFGGFSGAADWLSQSQSSSTISTDAADTVIASDPPTIDSPVVQSPSASKLHGDFNQDGNVDLLWRDYTTGQNLVWLMNGTTVTCFLELTPVADPNWRIQGTSDFNGDGYSDILWRHAETGSNEVWLMQGSTLLSTVTIGDPVPTHWRIHGIGDFNGDGHPDLVWRDYTTGANGIWLMNGTTLIESVNLPNVVGSNLKIHGVADFNQDGQVDVLWRNNLTGENFIWLMNGTAVSSMHLLPSADITWELQGTGDFDGDGKPDLLWQSHTSGALGIWVMNGLTYDRSLAISAAPALSGKNALSHPGSLALQDLSTPSSLVSLSQLSFSRQEGDAGSFQIQLNEAPTTNVTLTFTTGDFLVVDADGNIANGTQNAITFTPTDWNQARTVRLIAEVDGSSDHRLTGNTISYSLTGGFVGTGVYDLGTIYNTYAPDPTRFNIDLDFRNDTSGFWNATRQAVAQKAANDWAALIANEWASLQLNATGSTAIARMDSSGPRTSTFDTKRIVDDLVVFVNNLQPGAPEGGFGSPEYQFGGWVPNYYPGVTDPMPRVGQIAINTAVFTDESAVGLWQLYQIVLHEIGHTLGLLGMNWIGYNRVDRSNGIFLGWDGQGGYSRTANGGNYVTLQADLQHPAPSIQSIMSYGWLYNLYEPSLIDRALLADSGYTIVGINDTTATSLTTNSTPEATQLPTAGAAPPQAGCSCFICTGQVFTLNGAGITNLTDAIAFS